LLNLSEHIIYTTNNNRLWRTISDHLEGESMKVGFDGGIKLEFHGAKVTADGGLLAYRDLDDALGLFDSVSANFHDKRTGRNIRHAMPTLLRQSVYSRLAGYEDVNDAGRLSVDPVMRAITGKMAMASKPPAPTRWGVSKRR
jgi:Transposase DDE domain group 1